MVALCTVRQCMSSSVGCLRMSVWPISTLFQGFSQQQKTPLLSSISRPALGICYAGLTCSSCQGPGGNVLETGTPCSGISLALQRTGTLPSHSVIDMYLIQGCQGDHSRRP
ncbi:hypothetical protein KIPB_000379 [Kipferlia bialata]|uniref:Uncharacterized protein n=1 Tax=Kipferlia bialata TaxID=797122 RepID=A0A9K3CQE6_9EUKA|nr:hypothetical protein KIPB_000379 [Kipferlia bialata]|eukprot:g379.t1